MCLDLRELHRKNSPRSNSDSIRCRKMKTVCKIKSEFIWPR